MFDSRQTEITWPFLLCLVARNLKWASELARELWPADPAQGILIVNFVDDDFPSSSSIFALIQKSVLDFGIGVGGRCQTSWEIRASGFTPYDASIVSGGTGSSSWGTRFIGIKATREFAEFLNRRVDEKKWAPYVAAARFAKNPSKQSLAEALDLIVSSPLSFPILWEAASNLPWPIGACILASEDLAALAKFKTEALNKNLGDTGDWQQAEARWATMGVELADIENWNKINLFYDKTVARVGTPNGELIWVRPPRPPHPLIKTFHRLFLSATNPLIKSPLARVLAGELSGTREYYKEIGEALEYYASASPFAALNITMRSVLASPALPRVPLDVLDCIARAVQVNDLVFQARCARSATYRHLRFVIS